MNQATLEEQSNQLVKIRGWISKELWNAPDKEIQDTLFEAQQAIGFSLLCLERVEYRASKGRSERPQMEAGDYSSLWW
jgi:ABC-type cobalt transport system substrate-binding protein